MKILELLCPSDHLVAGLVFEEAEKNFDEARATVLELKETCGKPVFCIVCLSKNLRFELRDAESFRAASMSLIKKSQHNLELLRSFRAKAAFN